MRKYTWLVVLALITCTIAFASCKRMEQMIAPVMPEPEPPTEMVEPPVEMMPTDEGIGIFDTNVMSGHGLIAEAFYPGVKLTMLPDFDTLTPFHTWMVANIDVPHTRYELGFPGLGVDILENFAIRLRGQLKVETAGTYNFKIYSDDGSQLYINGALIIDNDGLHAFRFRSGIVMLDVGFHDVEIRYFQGPRAHIGLQWYWQPPGGEAIVPPEVLYPPRAEEMPEMVEPMVEIPPTDTEPPAEPPVTPPVEDSIEGMVLIPAGEFRMGNNSGYSDERPAHWVYVDAFYMDEHEVTNAEYAAFLNAQGKHADAGHVWLDIGDGDERIEFVAGVYRARAGYENHPVVEVSWYGAMAYALWKGKRLPTEAEWEKAARGGLSGKDYPRGNTIDPTRANYNDHIGGTTAVGKYQANGYGLYDMAGNVWEWCLDEYNADFYSISPARNPLSGANSIKWLLDNYTDVSSRRVLRGGSWSWPAAHVRVARRSNTPPTYTYGGGGFRCARAVTP